MRPYDKKVTPQIERIPGESQGFRNVRSPEWPGLVLVVPGKGQKMRFSEWSKEEKKFRSLVVNEETGEVVSSGFKKFANWGEDMISTEWMAERLAKGQEVYFTEKMDGSLVIRSVVGERVMLRTRGSLSLGDHKESVERVIAQKHPRLMDPTFRSNISILFEFTSPSFRIVLPYEEDSLTLLGGVRHRDLGYLAREDVERLGAEINAPVVPSHQMPTDHEELVREVSSWTDREGLVLSACDNEVMLKLKADDYLMRHRLRFALTARAVREVCLEEDVQTLADFEEYLTLQGGDWELVQDSRHLVEAFIKARETAQKELSQMQEEVPKMLEKYPERKDFAIEYATQLPSHQRGAAFALADGKLEAASSAILDHALDEEFRRAEEAESKLEDTSGW